MDRTGLPQPKVESVDGERECLDPGCPQGNVTVYLGFQYANRLSEMEGLEPCYTGGCYFDAALDQIGWYCMNSPEQAQPVAQKPPNAWGLHDMHGNVWEPVNDLYGPSGYLAGPYVQGEGPLVDPTGAVNPPDDITRTEERPTRVKRGGSHVGPAVYANVSRRLVTFDYGSGTSLGLRIVRTIFE